MLTRACSTLDLSQLSHSLARSICSGKDSCVYIYICIDVYASYVNILCALASLRCDADSEAMEAASDAEPHDLWTLPALQPCCGTARLWWLRSKRPCRRQLMHWAWTACSGGGGATMPVAQACHAEDGRGGNQTSMPPHSFRETCKETFREQCEAVVRSGTMLPQHVPTRVDKQGVLALQYGLEHVHIVERRHAALGSPCAPDNGLPGGPRSCPGSQGTRRGQARRRRAARWKRDKLALSLSLSLSLSLALSLSH